MTELVTSHRKLAKADEWIQEFEAEGGAGKLRNAALKIRKALEAAIKHFLAGVGPPPLRPKNPKELKDLCRLLESRYEKDPKLAHHVASALRDMSDPLHPDNLIGPPPADYVRGYLNTARQFIDSLEPIPANRQMHG